VGRNAAGDELKKRRASEMFENNRNVWSAFEMLVEEIAGSTHFAASRAVRYNIPWRPLP
jgi:hypothetical protein